MESSKCEYCGSELPASSWKCPFCGAPGPAQNSRKYGNPNRPNNVKPVQTSPRNNRANGSSYDPYFVPDNNSSRVNRSAISSTPTYNTIPSIVPLSERNPVNTKPNLPMNWHVFMVISLFIGCVVNVVNAFSVLDGTIHFRGYAAGNELDYYVGVLYSMYPSLKPFDVFCGFLMLGLTALGGLTAYKLFKYKKGAPQYLMYYYYASIAFSWFRSIITNAITSSITEDVIIQVISNTLAFAILLFINRKYYARRAFLFDE